jgi:hypothetical protein
MTVSFNGSTQIRHLCGKMTTFSYHRSLNLSSVKNRLHFIKSNFLKVLDYEETNLAFVTVVDTVSEVATLEAVLATVTSVTTVTVVTNVATVAVMATVPVMTS